MRIDLLRLSPCLMLVFSIACGGGADQSVRNVSTPAASPTTGVSGPAAAVAPRDYAGVGVVKALDPKASSIMINHGDIEGLMPAMEMEFHVSDAALLNGLRVNDQIDFTIQDRTGVLTVTSIKKK